MAYNGSGTWVRLYSWTNDAANNINIRADRMDNEFNDMCNNGLSFAITKDGQQNPTANLPMATFRHTGVGAAVNPTDYARADQVQNQGMSWGGTAAGTANALTISPTPVISAYVNGQKFRFKTGAAANTTAATLAVSGLGVMNITTADGTVATIAGDLQPNQIVEVTYDSGTATFVISGLVSMATLAKQIKNLGLKSAPDGTNDLLSIYSNADGILKKIAIGDVFKTIDGLTAKTALVAADEFVIDDSAASFAPKKVTLTNLFANAAVPFLTPASVTGAAGMNLPHGTAPSSPTNGDVWTTTAGLFIRINGVTIGPLVASTSPFSKLFTSTPQTITGGGALSLPHGLGVQPKFFSAYLVNVNTEGGYTAGQIMPTPIMQNTASFSQGVSLTPDATNLNVRYSSTANTFNGINNTNGNLFNITNANWTAVFQAWV